MSADQRTLHATLDLARRLNLVANAPLTLALGEIAAAADYPHGGALYRARLAQAKLCLEWELARCHEALPCLPGCGTASVPAERDGLAVAPWGRWLAWLDSPDGLAHRRSSDGDGTDSDIACLIPTPPGQSIITVGDLRVLVRRLEGGSAPAQGTMDGVKSPQNIPNGITVSRGRLVEDDGGTHYDNGHAPPPSLPENYPTMHEAYARQAELHRQGVLSRAVMSGGRWVLEAVADEPR